MRTLLTLALVAALTGCAARSKVTLADTTIPRPQGHAEPVCMLKSPLPSAVKYRVLGAINSSKRTYGSVSELIPLMATDARAIGADAIINLTTGQQMGALAWARPVGNGLAVQVADKESFNCIALGGELR